MTVLTGVTTRLAGIQIWWSCLKQCFTRRDDRRYRTYSVQPL